MSQKPKATYADVTHYRKTGSSMSLVIPKSIRGVLDWKDGELLIVRAADNVVVVFPVRGEMIDALGRQHSHSAGAD